MSEPDSWFGARGRPSLEQLGRLRERAGTVVRDRTAPAVTETAASVASPFRRAANLLLPVVSEHGGLIVEGLQSLRTRAADIGKPLAPSRTRN